MIDQDALTLPVHLEVPPAPILLRLLAASLRERAAQLDAIIDDPGMPDVTVPPAVESMGGHLTCPACGGAVTCVSCAQEVPRDGDG